jgi:hypothetical protein
MTRNTDLACQITGAGSGVGSATALASQITFRSSVARSLRPGSAATR